MNMRTLVVLAVAVLVPVFCVDIREQRCELRDRLRAAEPLENISESKMARVICEVEKSVQKSMMRPAALTRGSQHSSEGDSSEEPRGRGEVDTFLRQCVAVAKSTDSTVYSACFGQSSVFNMVYSKAGEECKKTDPVDFFQSCTNSKHSKDKRSLSMEPNENLDSQIYSEEQPKELSEEQFSTEEQSEEPSEEQFYSEEQSEEPSEEQHSTEEPSEEQHSTEEPSEEQHSTEEPSEEQFSTEEPSEEQFSTEEQSEEPSEEQFYSEEQFNSGE